MQGASAGLVWGERGLGQLLQPQLLPSCFLRRQLPLGTLTCSPPTPLLAPRSCHSKPLSDQTHDSRSDLSLG